MLPIFTIAARDVRVSNRIAYPGFDPGPAPEPRGDSSANTPPAIVKTPPSLQVSAASGSLILSGTVPDITLKSSFLKAVALTGKYLDVDSDQVVIDPNRASLARYASKPTACEANEKGPSKDFL